MKTLKPKPLQSFAERVREVVRQIPKGEVRTYGEVAALAGNPRAYRAVANTMANNFDKTVPCHRVIGKNGKLCGYNRGGIEKKRQLLTQEGVDLRPGIRPQIREVEKRRTRVVQKVRRAVFAPKTTKKMGS